MRDTKSLLGHQRTIRLGILLAQRLPYRAGRGLARLVADTIVRFRPQMYWNVYANFRQVLETSSEGEIRRTVRRAFRHAAYSYHEHFRALSMSPRELAGVLEIPQSFWEVVAESRERGQGVMMVTGHLSNFDLAALSMTVRGVRLQALSLPDPPPGFQFLNRLRVESGVEVTPITERAIREAVRRLREGGMAFTGVDYPTGPGREPLLFFGRPALLPTGHVRLAMMTGARLLVVRVRYSRGDGYALQVAPPVPLSDTGNKRKDVQITAERVLAILEGWIRETPEQWLMFLPVWPELLP